MSSVMYTLVMGFWFLVYISMLTRAQARVNIVFSVADGIASRD